MDLEIERDDSKVTKALKVVGVDVESVYDLVNTKKDYSAAIPVLIELLGTDLHYRVKEGVARALAVKEARPMAALPLLREFRAMNPANKPEEHAKWAVGMAVATVADDSVFNEVAAVLADSRHGKQRSGMVPALGLMSGHRAEAVDLLLGFLSDADLGVSAMRTLGAIREPTARQAIERFLKHPDSWVRQQAAIALKRIDKGESSPRRPSKAPKTSLM